MMRSPVRWYGGKGQMVAKLLPLLPPHTTYVEPFGGGASLLFAKAPAAVEVYNDIDSGVVNFYRVLRNPALFAEFVRLVQLTPYSREEWEAYRAQWAAETDPVQRAYKWFVYIRQNMNGGGRGRAGDGWSITTDPDSVAARKWTTALTGLDEVHARLQSVHIEHLDWREVLRRYDTPDTLFYCDPPYVQTTRGAHRYQHELTEADHADLVAALQDARGRVVLSGYAHAVYTPLEVAGWQRQDFAAFAHAADISVARVESVWMSPTCRQGYGPMFAGVA